MLFSETRAVGGGACSIAWNQIKADVLGIPYQCLKRSEFGTWGCALIAGKAVGLFDDLATKAYETAQPDGAPIKPDPARHLEYAHLVEKYIALEDVLNEYF